MAQNENATIGIYLNTDEAQRRLKDLQASAIDLKNKLDQMGKGSPERKEAQRQLREINKEIKGVQAALSKKVDLIINGQLAEGSIRDLQDASRKLWNEIRKLQPATQEFIDKSKRLQEVEARLKSLKEEARGTSGFWTRMKDELKAFGVMALGFLGFQALVGQISNVIQRNVKMSDSMADVMKTTGMTRREVEGLNKELGKMNTRTGRQELLGLATDAGKLGITGRDNVLGFVRAADKINVALGEDLGEGAIRNIGKLNDLFKVRENFGYEQGMLKIGSAINALGQSSTASEAYLVDFTKRLGGVATQAKISIQDILGMGATLDSLGQQAETSSTAVGKLLVDMFKAPGDYARIARTDVKSFTELLEKDANAAFIRVLEGLKGNNEGFTILAEKLKDVGVEGARGTAIISTLAGNVGMLRAQQALSNDEFQKGTSIMQEFNTKNENFAAKWEKLLKNIGRLFTNKTVTGLLENFVDLFNGIADRTPKLDRLTDSFNKQKAAVENYEKSLLPLINRYDELKAKTNPTKEEQDELKKIIEKISQTIPTAISEFDKYGKAMDINSGKAREYGENLKYMLQFKNKAAISEAKEELHKVTAAIENANRALSNRDASGDIYKVVAYTVKSAGGEFQTLTKNVKMSTDEIQTLQEKLSTLQGEETGIKMTINELSGEELFKIPKAADQINQEISDAPIEGFDISVNEDFVKNTQKLVSQLKDLRIEAIDDEEEREKAALKAKFERQSEEVRKAEADTVVKKQVLLALEEQYLKDEKNLIERYAREKNQEAFNRDSKDLQGWYEVQKLLVLEQLNRGEITETEHKAKLKKLEVDFLNEKLKLAQQYGQEVVAIEQQIQENIKTDREQGIADEKASRMAMLEFNLRYAKQGSREQLEARIALLTEQLHAELENTNLTAEQKQQVWRAYYDTLEQMNNDFLAGQLQEAKVYVDQFMGLFNNISSFLSAQAERDLAKDKKINDEKKRNLKAQLDSKKISEAKYRSEIERLDQQHAAKAAKIKRDAFERERFAKTISAIINTAVAVTNSLSAAPPPANYVLAALTAAAGAVEIATIQSQPAPEFEKGRKPLTSGIVHGPSHAQKGIRLVDGQTGRVIGEMEGNEGIFSRQMYASNKEIIDAIFAAAGRPVTQKEAPVTQAGGIVASIVPPDQLQQIKSLASEIFMATSLEKQTESIRNFREFTNQVVSIYKEKQEVLHKLHQTTKSEAINSSHSLESSVFTVSEAVTSISDRELLTSQQQEYFRQAAAVISAADDGQITEELRERSLQRLARNLVSRTLSDSTAAPFRRGAGIEPQRSVVSRTSDPASGNVPSTESTGYSVQSSVLQFSVPEIPSWVSQQVPAIDSERIIENFRLEESIRTAYKGSSSTGEIGFGNSKTENPEFPTTNKTITDTTILPAIYKLTQVLDRVERNGLRGVWEHRRWSEGLDDIEQIQAKARF
jgi:TP901 family phage tail tape measure protein